MPLITLSLIIGFQDKKPEIPFAKEIAAFVAADQKNPPAKGQILFVGSSSFQRWNDVATYFPKHRILNRGFGGSSLADVIRFQSQVIDPYQPAQVVIYCGENDIAGADRPSAYETYQRFMTLYGNIRLKMPTTPISYVSIKPSPTRWIFRWKMIAANAWIKDIAATDKNFTFIDVWEAMLDKDRRPIADIFVEDGIHMNAKGYKIWAGIIEPFLVKQKEPVKIKIGAK